MPLTTIQPKARSIRSCTSHITVSSVYHLDNDALMGEGGSLDIPLKEMCRKRSLKQRKFAERLAADWLTYGLRERGKQMINLEQACNCTVELDCSTDEIVCRPQRDPSEFSGPRGAELHRCYRSYDRDRQDRLLDTARDFADTRRDVAERNVSFAERSGIV